MSRRRRRRPNTKPVTNEAVAEKAQDGYVNSLAYLGEASPLSQANDYERHSISYDYNLLTVLYRENWLAARIIDTPCEDMTRSWYSISSEIDQEKLDELAKLEAKHSIKQEITNAIRWGRLYGGSAAVMVIKGQEDMLDQPLDYDMLQPGCFRGLIVIDKVRGIFPSIELEEDMDDPEFGYPKWYQVTLNEETGEIIRIHHSRLLLFRGRQLPIDEEINADYWGASELEHVYEELQKRNSSSANIAQLIFQANVAALKISDYGEVLGMGTAAQRKQVYNYISEMNRLRTSFGIALMSNEDNYEQHPYSFAGVAEVYETFMMDMAGASEIPATKLFGRAPQGMNATGESDMKNYYEVIAQLQERILRPALEKLLPVMCMSLWGEVPEDMEVVFEPLGTTTPSERAEIMGQFANPIIQAFSAGLISQQLALKELRETGKPINAWTNISDEDIENAEAEVDQGEGMEDPMGMMGGMPPEGMEAQVPPEGMPPETQAQLEGAPDGTQAQLEEMPVAAQVQPEVDMDKVHELKERISKMRGTQATPETGDGETQARLEKIRELQARIEKLRGNTAEDDDEPEQPGTEVENAEFEAKHPRGPGGRFAGKTGGESAPSRLVNGMKRLFGGKNVASQATNTNVARQATNQNKNVARQATKTNVAQKNVAPQATNRMSNVFNYTSGALRAVPSNGNTAIYNSQGRVMNVNTEPQTQWAVKSVNMPQNVAPQATNMAKARQGELLAKQNGNNGKRTTINLQPAQKKEITMRPLERKKTPLVGHDRRARKMMAQVAEAAENGDFAAVKDIVGAYKAGKKTRTGFFRDALTFLREQLDGGPGSGNHGHAGRPGKRGGSASESSNSSESAEPSGGGDYPVDNGTHAAYNERATKGWKRLGAAMKVAGPAGARKYIEEYFSEHPDVAQQATKYMDVRKKVQNFLTDHPEAENFNTYDAETGKAKNITSGFCVTFHQNNTADDPLGGYTDEDYANLCAIAVNELGASGVNIGYYGNPEVSFECPTEDAAKRFAVEHNQQSIYNASTGRTLVNKEWRKDLNPIRL